MSRCDECDPADLMVFGHACDCTRHGIIRRSPTATDRERHAAWHRFQAARQARAEDMALSP